MFASQYESRARTRGARWHSDYLARAMLLPCVGGYFALQQDDTYDVVLSLVAMFLWRAESFLNLNPRSATCVHYLLLLWRTEFIIDEISITDVAAT